MKYFFAVVAQDSNFQLSNHHLINLSILEILLKLGNVNAQRKWCVRVPFT